MHMINARQMLTNLTLNRIDLREQLTENTKNAQFFKLSVLLNENLLSLLRAKVRNFIFKSHFT